MKSCHCRIVFIPFYTYAIQPYLLLSGRFEKKGRVLIWFSIYCTGDVFSSYVKEWNLLLDV